MELKQHKKDLRRASNTAGLMMIVFYALSIGVSFLLPFVLSLCMSPYSSHYEDVYQLAAYTIQYPVIVPTLLLLFWLLCGRKNGISIRKGFAKPAVPVWRMLVWIVMCAGLIYMSAYLSQFLNVILESAVDKLFGIDLVQPEMAARESLMSKIGNIYAIVLLAPFFEELLFRASIFRSLQPYGNWPAAVMCGILFGLWHANYGQTLYAAVMGICACFLVVKTGTVLAPYLLHLFINTIGGIQSLFIGGIDQEKLLEADIEWMIENIGMLSILMVMGGLILCLMLAAVIILILELVFHRETFRMGKSETGLTGGQAFLTMLTSPGMLLAWLMLIAMTVLRAVGLW